MADNSYDVVIIGGGPGGYVAAIAASQLGLSVACVENRGALGGTCLNVGCIPSKTLLHWSERYYEAAHLFAAHGIKTGKLSLDLKAMMADKDKVVGSFTKGIEGLFKKNKVDYLPGTGRIVGKGKVAVSGDAGDRDLTAGHIIIATGSVPATVPGLTIDENKIVSSTGGLALTKVPKSMVVVGAGYIGLELGSVWRRLGAEVTVVEFLDRIVPTMDTDLATAYGRELTKQGLQFRLGTKVTGAKAKSNGVTLDLQSVGGDGAAEQMTVEVVLVAVGRMPYTDGLGLVDAGVALDNHGFIMVDAQYRTNVDGISAIGDVIPGPMLAHKASFEGIAAAEIIAGKAGHVNYDVIPAVVYTDPEVAWVGKGEDELKAAGVAYKKGTFPFMANSRAKTVGHTAGMTKVLTDPETDRILGVHILGTDAGALIAEAAVAMEFSGSAEDVARTCHAHPTLNEAVMEAAALASTGKTIHI